MLFRKAGICFFQPVYFADVNDAVTKGPRHIPVYLGDNKSCVFCCGSRNVNGSAERTKAMLIRRRNLHKRDIQWQNAFLKKLTYLAKENRDVIVAIRIDYASYVPGDKH